MARRTVTTTLKIGAATMALSAAWPALAAQDSTTAQPSEAQAAATSDDTAATDPALVDSDIVVTARRRAESLQDVPISVSAFSGEALENTGAVDVTDLQKRTPNLTLQIARGSNSTLIAFIRGVGQQDPLWGFEPGVGLYVDDVYVARPQGAVLDIFDVERVEVLRGPQGTLYGRNTIGGAVKYVSRRLGDDFSFRARGAVGSYEQRDLILSTSIPITEGLAVGGALAIYKRDGFGENVTSGAEHYNKDVQAGRISLEFTPSDNIFFRIAADRTEDDSNARHGFRELPGAAGNPPVLDSVYDTLAGIGDKNRVMTQGVSLTGEIGLSDALTVKSISAWREGETETVIDFDGTVQVLLDIPAFYEDRQFSQELQLLWQGERVQGVAGLYYFNGRAAGAFDTVVSGGAVTVGTSGNVKTESYAAFADFSIDITDQLKASVGGRYTSEKREGTVFRANYLGNRSPALGNNAAVLLGTALTNYTNDRTFNQFTPRFSVSYEPNRDLTLYASYSKGFKSGGFDMRGDATLVPNTWEGYDPETVDAYEVGVKGAFLGRRLFLNLAGYYSDYKGQQITLQTALPPLTPGGPARIASQVDNVGDSRIWGMEFEGRAIFNSALSSTFAVGYTNADFKRYLALDVAAGKIRDFADERVFQNTPEWNVHVAFTYEKDLGGSGRLSVTPSLSYRTDYSLFEIRNPVLDQGGFALADASVVWDSADEKFQVGAHVRNIFDKQYRVGGYVFPTFNNSIIGFYGPPRTFTVTAQVKF